MGSEMCIRDRSGRVLDLDEMKAWVDLARSTGAVLASDECYGEFVWEGESVSVLDERVNSGDVTGLLACLSMSKRSNMAGYRAGFAVGDAELTSELLTVRKHSGLMIPAPVVAAMQAALADRSHVLEQVKRYRLRRNVLKPALEKAGFRIDLSEGSLYLWATHDEDCRVTLDRLADLGILCSPGDFYVAGGSDHVRIGLTATDERINAAAQRIQP